MSKRKSLPPRNHQSAYIKYNEEGEAIDFHVNPYEDENNNNNSGWEAEYKNPHR